MVQAVVIQTWVDLTVDAASAGLVVPSPVTLTERAADDAAIAATGAAVRLGG